MSEAKRRRSARLGLGIATGWGEEKFIKMPEAAEFSAEIAIAVARLARDGRGDDGVEIGELPGGRILSGLSGLPVFRAEATVLLCPDRLRLAADLPAECGDGGEAEVAPFEARRSFHRPKL